MPWQTLVAQFEQVRPMIAAAPGLFALLVMACLLAAWGFVHLLHRQSFKNKETEIGHKNAEIAWLRQQKEDAGKRLALAQAAPSRADTTVGAADPASAGPSAQITPQESVKQSLYVGRVEVDTNRLESDFVLEFAFVAFNGGSAPLRLAGLRGRVAYGKSVVAPEADWAMLPTPAIRDDNLATFTPFSEFLVVVTQGVPGALAAEIGRGLAAGERVMFVLEGLNVLLAAKADADGARLPV